MHERSAGTLSLSANDAADADETSAAGEEHEQSSDKADILRYTGVVRICSKATAI